MKKKLLMMMLAVMLLLVACGNADSKDTEANTQQTESQSTSETETLEADTEEETTTEAINTEVENETSTQTESETSQPSEEPSEPQYTYTDLNKTMYAKSSVNVRSLPSTDGQKLGGLSKGQEVSVTGQCNETGWYRIEYNGGVAYISSNYLTTTKPTETSSNKNESGGAQSGETPSTSNVPADYSSTALYDYNDERVQQLISEGTPCPTVDYNTVPVVDITPMIQPEKMGENCSGLSNLSTQYWYDYDRYDYTKRLTWNSEIPMYQYIIWDGKLGFFSDFNHFKQYEKLWTTDFQKGLEEGKAHQIRFGTNVSWSGDGNEYYFYYLTEW